MNKVEQRIAEIYSYYLDERYQNDLSVTFVEWLTTSMYGDELTKLAQSSFDRAVEVTHEYHTDSIPGGHECPHCGLVNTCYFVKGWYVESQDGRRHTNVVRCEECGDEHSVEWFARAEAVTGGSVGTGISEIMEDAK